MSERKKSEEKKDAGEGQHVLTNRQGHPVYDNQNNRAVGDRGPTVLENYQFLEKISHFDRERIPERVVHARGAGAHGYFEAYGTIGDDPSSKYTRAKLFQEKGKRTPVFVRFSTVIHGGHSPENLRDPRGFAVKFYTEDGNWDLVHAFKPDPVTNRQDARRIFDFISLTPQAMHMITWLFSPWGIPANYREMFVQAMSDDAHDELDFDPPDATKIWPEGQFPLLPVGRLVLDKNPVNYLAEVEQVAFGTSVLVDGLDFSDDKLLQGRTFSYSDTQRHRVGSNYLQLPINRPKTHVATNQRDGQMAYHVDGLEGGENPHVNYEPSSKSDSLREAPRNGKDHTPFVSGNVVRQKIGRQNNYGQAGERFRAMDTWERDELVSNLVGALSLRDEGIQERMVSHLTQCDPTYGRRVAEGLGVQSKPEASAADAR